MASPFIGEIIMFAGNFAPRNYSFCNGQLMAIAQNTALFNILGTTYGGNGTSNFGLPNLQACLPLAPGQGGSGPLGSAGGSQPHKNLMPSLCVNFVIAVSGIFPSRN